MSDAPKRIHAWVYRDGDRMTHCWHGKIGNCGPNKTEYVRADIADDMLDALHLAEGFLKNKGYSEHDPLVRGAIRAAIAKAKGGAS